MNFIQYVANSRNIPMFRDDDVTVREALGRHGCFGDNGRLSADGYALDCPDLDNPIILFKNKSDKEKRRFTIAHELGHVFAGHLSSENQKGAVQGIVHTKELEASMIGAVLLGLSLYDEWRRELTPEDNKKIAG